MQNHEHEPNAEGRSPITIKTDLLLRLEMAIQAFDMSIASLDESKNSGFSVDELVDSAVETFLLGFIDEYDRSFPE